MIPIIGNVFQGNVRQTEQNSSIDKKKHLRYSFFIRSLSGSRDWISFSLHLAQRLTVKLFGLICCEWPWSFSSFSFHFNLFLSIFFHEPQGQHTYIGYKSLAWAFCSSLVPSGPECVSVISEGVNKQTNKERKKQTNKWTNKLCPYSLIAPVDYTFARDTCSISLFSYASSKNTNKKSMSDAEWRWTNLQ